MAAEKMNVYVLTKDKITKLDKSDLKWFKLLPKSKDDKRKSEDYWTEIRSVLVGKKTNKNLKIVKHKGMKFIAFSVVDNKVLAFAIGTEKSDSLNELYKIVQEKQEKTDNESKSNKRQTKPESQEETLYQAEINNINWDTYDEVEDETLDPAEIGLPKGVSMYNIEADSIEDAKDQIADLLSDYYGWLVYGFDIDELKVQTENNHKDFENETYYDSPVIASEENKSESLAEVEYDYTTNLINKQDAIDTIIEMGEAKNQKEAEKIVNSWTKKIKKDTGKSDAYFFRLICYMDDIKDFEDFDEYKKWEHHFEYLYGDTNPGNYWGIKVKDYIDTDCYIEVTGYIEGVEEDEFYDYIQEGNEEYNFSEIELNEFTRWTGKEITFEDIRSDYQDGTIDYEEACQALIEIGEAESRSDAQALVEAF